MVHLLGDAAVCAILQLRKELGLVSNFNQLLIKDRVCSSDLTKFDAFRLNRNQVLSLETLFKIHIDVSNFETASPKPFELLNVFDDFCDFYDMFWQTLIFTLDFSKQ